MRFSPSLIVALLAAACAEPAKVASTAPAEAPIFITAGGDTIRMHEALRIGQLSGLDEYTFAMIDWTLPTPDGGVLLYDAENSGGGADHGRIRRFDAQGRFVRYVGGPGEGPGEYSPFPDGLLLNDGDLLLTDQGLGRITRFDSAGKLVASWPGPTPLLGAGLAGDGGWFIVTSAGSERGKPPRIEYLHFDSAGNKIGRVTPPAVYLNGPYAGRGAVESPSTYLAILPDGRLVTSISDSLAFTVTSEGRDTSVNAPHQPVAFLPEEVEAKRALLARLSRGTGADPSQLEVPRFKKVFSAMFTDAGGRILFRMRTRGYRVEPVDSVAASQSPWREPLELEVFDSTLTHRGRLVAPRRVSWRGASFSDDAVWLVEEGDSGELYLVKWRPDSVVW